MLLRYSAAYLIRPRGVSRVRSGTRSPPGPSVRSASCRTIQPCEDATDFRWVLNVKPQSADNTKVNIITDHTGVTPN